MNKSVGIEIALGCSAILLRQFVASVAADLAKNSLNLSESKLDTKMMDHPVPTYLITYLPSTWMPDFWPHLVIFVQILRGRFSSSLWRLHHTLHVDGVARGGGGFAAEGRPVVLCTVAGQ